MEEVSGARHAGVRLVAPVGAADHGGIGLMRNEVTATPTVRGGVVATWPRRAGEAVPPIARLIREHDARCRAGRRSALWRASARPSGLAARRHRRRLIGRSLPEAVADRVDTALVPSRIAGANYDPATAGSTPVSGYPETTAPPGRSGRCAQRRTRSYDYGFDNFAGFPNTHDAGIVVLDQSIRMPRIRALAAVGAIEACATAGGRRRSPPRRSGSGLSLPPLANSAVATSRSARAVVETPCRPTERRSGGRTMTSNLQTRVGDGAGAPAPGSVKRESTASGT